MRINIQKEIISACSDGNLIFYKLKSDEAKMIELARVKADFP